jgi:hypothetical protein
MPEKSGAAWAGKETALKIAATNTKKRSFFIFPPRGQIAFFTGCSLIDYQNYNNFM